MSHFSTEVPSIRDHHHYSTLHIITQPNYMVSLTLLLFALECIIQFQIPGPSQTNGHGGPTMAEKCGPQQDKGRKKVYEMALALGLNPKSEEFGYICQ